MNKSCQIATIVYLCFLANLVFSQNSSDAIRKIGLRPYVGNIFVHSEDVENTSGSRPFAIDLEFSKRFKGENIWNLCRCYPTSGFVAGYQDYDNEILGKGAHIAYFVQYHFLQLSKISPFIRATGGLSYNSSPHDEIKNPENQSYSLPVNFSLQFAGGVEFQVNKNWLLDLNTSFNHISNGGLEQPNKGINWLSFGLGTYYMPDYSPFKNRDDVVPHKNSDNDWFRRIELNGSALSRTFDEKERFLVFGSEFLLGYYLSNLHSLLGGLEWNLDQSLARKIEYEELEKTANRLSFNLGHEFILGNFRFSQKLGIYLLDQVQENDLIYHKWGMSYLHKSGTLLGVEVKAHRHVAEFIVGKIGFQF